MRRGTMPSLKNICVLALLLCTTVPFASGNDSFDEAQLIENNVDLNASISPAGDNDYFRLVLNIAGRLTVHTTGETDTYGHLYGYQFNQNRQLITEDDDSGPDSNFLFDWQLESGIHYIRVRHYSNTGTGDYVLHVSFLGGGVNDSFASAGFIENNDDLNASINTAGDNDYFHIEPSEPGTLTVNTTGETDTFGYLYDSENELVRSNDDSGTGSNFSLNAEVGMDTYFIRVRHFSDTGTGAYVLQTRLVGNNDTIDSAEFIGKNVDVNSRIDPAGDDDWYRVELIGSGTLTFNTTGGTNTFGSLYGPFDGDSRRLIATNDDSGSGGNFRINWEFAIPGIYYLKVDAASGTIGNYVLQARYDGHNNSFAEAPRIASDVDNFSANISTAGDNDYYRLELTESGTLYVNTTGETDTFGYLYDSENELVISDDDSNEGGNFLFDYEVGAGTYYIRVRHFSDTGTGAYVLQVRLEIDIESETDVFGGQPIAGFAGWMASPWYLNYNVDFWPWIYHDEHGWQFVFEYNEEVFYLFDSGLSNWIFVNQNTYRWIKLYGLDSPYGFEEWIWTYDSNTPDRRYFGRSNGITFSVPPGLPVQ